MNLIPALVLVLSLTGISRAAEAPLDLKESSLTFTGHAFLHNFDGAAQNFHGSAQIDGSLPSLVVSAVIDIPAAKMTTFENARDRNMRDWLHVTAHPGIEFRLASVAPEGDPAKATRVHPLTFTVHGTLTINGTDQPFEDKVTGWREGAKIIVAGVTKIDTTTFGLPIVKQLFMTVDKQVEVAFHLVFVLPASGK